MRFTCNTFNQENSWHSDKQNNQDRCDERRKSSKFEVFEHPIVERIAQECQYASSDDAGQEGKYDQYADQSEKGKYS